MPKKAQVVEVSRTLIENEDFKNRNRKAETMFTRIRCLPFALVLIMILRKSTKSLQCIVNETVVSLGMEEVSASAYSQARYKLKHTAFIELNQKAIVDVVYQDQDFKTFWGKRLLAIDGSKIRLPNTEEICAEFGTIAYSQGEGSDVQGEHPYALGSVMYDVLNRVAIDATLGRANAYEVDLAIAHLAHVRCGDLLLMDRNYPSYRMLATTLQSGCDLVIRCSAASYDVARQMLKGEGEDSQVVTLTPCAKQVSAIRAAGLPETIRVRFVRVLLSTGEFEVLVTTLLDEALYPTEDFLELYNFRWGIETFYGLLKTRLTLENFTGLGVEAVKQDFYATIYLSGLESVLTGSAQEILDAKETQHPQKVNRAVSFNAIKTQAFALLMSSMASDVLIERLTVLFLQNPCLERKDRNPPRKKSSATVLLNYHKRVKKQCF
jgi:Transposase DDE domain